MTSSVDITVITVGTQGMPGAQGAQGPQGIGIQGPAGVRGPQGIKGDTGPFGVISGSGNVNSIPFFIDTVTLAPSNLYQVNSRLAVNTNSPDVPLHIAISGASTIRIGATAAQHIDLGDTGPQARLGDGTVATYSVNAAGGSTLFGGDVRPGIGIFASGVGQMYKTAANGISISAATGSAYGLSLISPNGNVSIGIATGTDNVVLVPTAGGVTIGSNASPLATLDVAGTVRSNRYIRDSGFFVSTGDAVSMDYISRAVTTDVTQTELFTDGSALRVPLGANRSFIYRIDVVARSTNGADSMMAVFEGGVDSSPSNVLTQRPETQSFLYQSNGAWAFLVDVDNVNFALRMRATGAASTTIHWVAYVRLTSVV